MNEYMSMPISRYPEELVEDEDQSYVGIKPRVPRNLATERLLEHSAKVGARWEAGYINQVDHPPHYNNHPSGVECIQVTEHMGFCLGNAVKYIWRADEKGNAVEDLLKAKWYIERELALRTTTRGKEGSKA